MANPKRRGRKMFTKGKKGQIVSSRRRQYVSFSSLSDIEDRKDFLFWNKVTQDAAVKAINENKAMNIPVTVLEDGWIVQKFQDGTVVKVKKIETSKGTNKSYGLIKGSILHVKSN